MKTKNLLFSLLLVGAAGVMGAYAQQKPKLAVLVVGMESDAKGDDFAARLGSDLNRDGEYDLQTKDNNPDVALKLTALRAAHTPGTPADTSGLAAWGKSKGIGFVQLVVQATDAGGKTSRVAQLVSCSTGQLSGRGTYRMEFAPKEIIEMVPVTGGVFEMGCKPDRDGWCLSRETPSHHVRVNDFQIGKYEVTQAQWEHVMGSLPSNLTSNTAYLDPNKPVIYVSYDDVAAENTGFLAKLNALTGKSYRLPTEAEWEYAARGCSVGTCDPYKDSGSDNVGDVGWCDAGNLNSPQPVGKKSPNGLGIYDMSGNVFEWCRDYYSTSFYEAADADNPLDNPVNTDGNGRVARGGSWCSDARACHVAYREGVSSGNETGFRVVLP
jgi:formylglycine-generating enzyme required for sulfatase activity